MVGRRRFHLIQKTVTAVLEEEKQRNRAIDKKLPMLFPCRCRILCSNRELLRPVIWAFDKLYIEYMELHKDYSRLFQAAWIRRQEEKIYYSRRPPPPEVEPQRPFVIEEVSPFEDEIADYWAKEAAKTGAEEVTGSGTSEERRLETVRVRMRYKSRNPFRRFISWCRSIVYAYRDCTCLNCDYREGLLDFRAALTSLQREYTTVYLQYTALISALQVRRPAPGDDIKYILVRDLDAITRWFEKTEEKKKEEIKKAEESGRETPKPPSPPPPPPSPLPPAPILLLAQPNAKPDAVQLLLDQCECEMVTADITEDLR
ncbi:unnamed protein product [Dibothriocephalus latus]|uniref:Uncharacterized protein n=1 Tax=Dibothriocephalus latus TaxID=60516 RepID=A0A3P7LBG3_DIBLA|nr:unnamed protein product [Dibothriocephalus latus]